MSARCIVPIEPAGGSGEIVVVEVQQQGTHPLDVRLVGCEGENPYIATLQHHNLAKLKRKYKGSDEDWVAILSYFLLQQQLGPNQESLLEGVRPVYSIKKKSLQLSIRQDVQGIKIVLGEIVLTQDDEFEFNPFAWAQVSAMAHLQTMSEISELRAQMKKEQDTIVKLSAQLDDFIKTRDETEAAMLQYFMELLNEKKRKIRDQNRLLAGVKIEAETSFAVRSTRPERASKSGSSRGSKRKALAQTLESDPSPASDDDQMEIDQAKLEEHEEDEDEVPEPVTPDHPDDETDAEDEESELQTRVRPPRTSATASKPKEDTTGSKGIPPPRSLPFGKPTTRSGNNTMKLSPAPPDDDGEETDDEEL